MLVLDTDILIDIQRGYQPAVEWFGSLQELPLIPGFVVMELIQDARNGREVERALRLTAPFRVIWPTEADCQRALADFSAYHLSDNLGLLDALIAASALGSGGELCSFNVKHYRPIRGLTVRQPYAK